MRVCVLFFRVLSRKSGYLINLIYSSPHFSLRDESLYQQCVYIMKVSLSVNTKPIILQKKTPNP
jgi:hypothetical protein